jgi:uncharacterized membrane protein YkgB
METETSGNGAVAAAALAVGLGALAFGIAVVASEASPALAAKLNWYNPTGPLSGKASVGIIVWLVAWAVLSALWKRGEVKMKPVLTATLVLIALGFILTFPPVFDAIAGK